MEPVGSNSTQMLVNAESPSLVSVTFRVCTTKRNTMVLTSDTPTAVLGRRIMTLAESEASSGAPSAAVATTLTVVPCHLRQASLTQS